MRVENVLVSQLVEVQPFWQVQERQSRGSCYFISPIKLDEAAVTIDPKSSAL